MSHATIEHTVYGTDMKTAFEEAREELSWDGDNENFDTIYDVRPSRYVSMSEPLDANDYMAVQAEIDREVNAHFATWNSGARFRHGFRNDSLDTTAVAIPVVGADGRRGWTFVANIHI